MAGSRCRLSVPLVTAFLALAAAASDKTVPTETLLVLEPSAENPRNSEGDFVALADGAILFAYSRFTGGGSDFAAADIVARTSRDGGRTWSQDRVLVPNEGQSNVMSVSLLRLPSGEILLFYARKHGWGDCNLYVRRSVDELQSLSEPVRATAAPGYHVINNDRVVRLASGRLIVPAALHPCPDGTRKTWSGNGVPRAFYSDDDGRTWHADQTVVEPPPRRSVCLQEPGILELKTGTLWMWMRTTAGVQYQCFSRDAGLHWTEPEPTTITSPCSPASIERIPQSDALLMVWNDHSGRHPYPGGRRTPLCVALSRDEGKTWSPSRVIEGNLDGWYCYTAIAFVGDRILLAYCAGDKKVGGLNRLKVVGLKKADVLAGDR